MSIFESLRSDPLTPARLVPEAATRSAPDNEGSGGFDLSLFVQLGASLGQLADGLQADRDRRDVSPPGNNQLFAAGVVPNSGQVTLDLGSVPQGHVWQVRRLVVGGTTVTTAAAGSAYAFSAGAPPDLSLTDCVDIFLTLPQGDTFGTHQLFLLPGEHLWIVFVGATPTQQYAASARVEDWEEQAFLRTFSEQ
jgi:hypothetical protein